MNQSERNLIRDAMMFAVKDITGRVMREAAVQSMIDDFKKLHLPNVVGSYSEKDIDNVLVLFDVMPRSFGMVRWYSNTDGDVACVSIERAKEYVETYNKLSGKEDCYVDEEVWLLLNEV